MFDGRKDQTLTKISNRVGIEIRELVTQDHYTLLQNNQLVFIEISYHQLVEKLWTQKIKFFTTTESEKSLRFNGKDGTAVNARCNNGVIRKVEETLGQPF